MAFKAGKELMPRNADGTVAYSNVHYTTTWPKMEECVTLGLTRSIGVSNFNSKQIDEILSIAKIRPVTNQVKNILRLIFGFYKLGHAQVELHPYLTQVKLQKFCAERDMVLTGYSPLGSPDRPWAKTGDPDLLHDPRIKAIADKHGKSPAQVLLRYQVCRVNL